MKLTTLKENELYIFDGKILRLIKSPFNKSNNEKGLRPILKQLKQGELNKILIELKGGVKE